MELLKRKRCMGQYSHLVAEMIKEIDFSDKEHVSLDSKRILNDFKENKDLTDDQVKLVYQGAEKFGPYFNKFVESGGNLSKLSNEEFELYHSLCTLGENYAVSVSAKNFENKFPSLCKKQFLN